MNLVILTLFWVFYFIIHSVLAGSIVKIFVHKRLNLIYPYYRIFFNIIAVGLLLGLLNFQSHIGHVLLFKTNAFTQYFGYVILVSGMVLTILSFKKYSTLEFLGFDINKKTNTYSLSTSGLNSYVRHPLYFATLLLIWGYFIIKPKTSILIMNIVSSVYLYIGTRLEEKKLIIEYGKDYVVYIKKVPMLIPYTIKKEEK